MTDPIPAREMPSTAAGVLGLPAPNSEVTYALTDPAAVTPGAKTVQAGWTVTDPAGNVIASGSVTLLEIDAGIGGTSSNDGEATA